MSSKKELKRRIKIQQSQIDSLCDTLSEMWKQIRLIKEELAEDVVHYSDEQVDMASSFDPEFERELAFMDFLNKTDGICDKD